MFPTIKTIVYTTEPFPTAPGSSPGSEKCILRRCVLFSQALTSSAHFGLFKVAYIRSWQICS